MRNTLGADKHGLQLLRCVRAYVELDVLASFDVHTDQSIKRGQKTVKKFVTLANVSIVRSKNTFIDVLGYVRNTTKGPGTFLKCISSNTSLRTSRRRESPETIQAKPSRRCMAHLGRPTNVSRISKTWLVK